jgi:hypothetical protein
MTLLEPQVTSVYAEHGCAMGEAQLVEQYLGFMIFAAGEPPDGVRFSPEAYDALVTQVARMTIGQKAAKLAAHLPISEELASRFLRPSRDWNCL